MLFVLYIYINIYNAYGAYLVEYLYNFFLYQLELLLARVPALHKKLPPAFLLLE